MPRHEVGVITITEKEYRKLLQDQYFLECLKSCGVDNWCGYSDAVDMFEAIEE